MRQNLAILSTVREAFFRIATECSNLKKKVRDLNLLYYIPIDFPVFEPNAKYRPVVMKQFLAK